MASSVVGVMLPSCCPFLTPRLYVFMHHLNFCGVSQDVDDAEDEDDASEASRATPEGHQYHRGLQSGNYCDADAMDQAEHRYS